MPVAERTYSFKASATLGDRVREASRTLAETSTDDDLVLEVARRLAADLRTEIAEATEGDRTNQSALFRGVLEILVAAVEHLSAERVYAAEYAAMAYDDPERDEFARAALAAGGALWRDQHD